MLDFFRRFPLLALAIGVVLVLFILLILILFPSERSQTTTNLPTPTPVSVDVSNEPLTQNEQNFPQATPQPFRNPEASGTGTLVVTSDIEGVVVLLDAIGIHPEEGDPIAKDEKWPENPVPFTVRSMPAGKHFLTAVAPGKPYDIREYEYEIKTGETTRINIKLKPLRTSN